MIDRLDRSPLSSLACPQGTDFHEGEALGKPLDDQPITGARPPILPIFLWLMLPVYFLLADLFLVPGTCIWSQRDWGAVFVYMTFGIVMAQFAVVPAWLAWGTSPFWQRLVTVIVLSIVFWIAWLVGFPVGDAIDRRELGSLWDRRVLAVLFLLPAIVLAIDVPLRTIRVLFGWRISPYWNSSDTERPLAISDLLTAMATVAMALTCARLAKGLISGVNETEFWFGLAIGAASGAGSSLVIVAPLAWLTFRTRTTALRIAGVAIFGTVALVVVWAVLLAVSRGRRMDWWESLGISISMLTFLGVTAGVFSLFRAAGYRLEVRSRVGG